MTLDKEIIEEVVKHGMKCRKMNGDVDFLRPEDQEGFTYHSDGSITTFVFDGIDRIKSELQGEVSRESLTILKAYLFYEQDNVVVEDKGVSVIPYELPETITSDYLNKRPSSIETLLLFQRTPEQYIKTRKGRGGKDVKYVDGNYMTRVLNAAFCFDWNFETLDIKQDGDQISVLGKLTVNMDGKIITREQWGGQTILPKMEMGDALKGATTDALKKCASTFGIASDVYGGEIEE